MDPERESRLKVEEWTVTQRKTRKSSTEIHKQVQYNIPQIKGG